MLKGNAWGNFWPNLGKNPGIGDNFGLMQIKTLKLRQMKPCTNKSILWNNILDIQSTLKVC